MKAGKGGRGREAEDGDGEARRGAARHTYHHYYYCTIVVVVVCLFVVVVIVTIIAKMLMMVGRWTRSSETCIVTMLQR